MISYVKSAWASDKGKVTLLKCHPTTEELESILVCLQLKKKRKYNREMVVLKWMPTNAHWIHKDIKTVCKADSGNVADLYPWMLSPRTVIGYDGWTSDALMLGIACQCSPSDIWPLSDPVILDTIHQAFVFVLVSGSLKEMWMSHWEAVRDFFHIKCIYHMQIHTESEWQFILEVQKAIFSSQNNPVRWNHTALVTEKNASHAF